MNHVPQEQIPRRQRVLKTVVAMARNLNFAPQPLSCQRLEREPRILLLIVLFRSVLNRRRRHHARLLLLPATLLAYTYGSISALALRPLLARLQPHLQQQRVHDDVVNPAQRRQVGIRRMADNHGIGADEAPERGAGRGAAREGTARATRRVHAGARDARVARVEVRHARVGPHEAVDEDAPREEVDGGDPDELRLARGGRAHLTVERDSGDVIGAAGMGRGKVRPVGLELAAAVRGRGVKLLGGAGAAGEEVAAARPELALNSAGVVFAIHRRALVLVFVV